MAKKKSKSQVLKNKKINTSTMRATKNAPRIAYQYKINMVISAGGESKVDQQFIKYVVFDYDYENYTIPVIYVGFSATKEIYNKLMKYENQKTGKVFFSLFKNNAYSNTALNVKTVNGQFSYIPSTSNLNYTEELDDATTADNSYRTITIALISEELNNRTKTYINRIFTKTSTNNLIAIALEGLDKNSTMIMRAPQYAAELENQVIPPMTNRKQLLEYIFNEAPFYDTNFTFFLDFDKSYLIDRMGEGAQVEDGTLHTVIFNIDKATSGDSYKEGIEEQKGSGAYIVNINPANANASLNRSQDRVANRLVVVNEDGYDENMDVNIEVNSTAYSADKVAFKRAVDANLIKNNMESNTLFFTVQKQYIDANVFTPNKKYIVANYSGGDDYNGTYTLSYKREVIVNDGGTFNESSEFGLRKVGNITSTGGFGLYKASENSRRSDSYYTTQPPKGNTNLNTPSNTSQPSNNTNVLSTISGNSGEQTNTTASSVAVKGYRPLYDAAGPSVILKETPQLRSLMRD